MTVSEAGGTLVWFRQDLRVADNPALYAAAARGEPVVPVYVWSPDEEGKWPPGAAQRWWLHQSLSSLDRQLRALDSRLTLAQGPTLKALLSAAAASGARTVHFNERYEPEAAAACAAIEAGLRDAGLETQRFNSALLAQPHSVHNSDGRPYRVYTAFQRAFLKQVNPGAPLRSLKSLRPPEVWPDSATLESLHLLPERDWYRGMADSWTPGEAGAHRNLQKFLAGGLSDYHTARDIPSVRGTSRLSPYLHFGEIGPRQIWHSLRHVGGNARFLSELTWREFAYHLLYHFPATTDEPLRREFKQFPWKTDPALLRSWQRGETGIPLVDAGMRELWATGWMHNRVRMVSASFLVKNLLIPWQQGARWFWDTLIDADLANNTLNWQWVAGCGVDAAPFFRIFNPNAQARQFDTQGQYVRRWIPELQGDGRTYPSPIVDLKESRAAALEAFEALREGAVRR